MPVGERGADASRSSYDVVVIGGGMAGLTAGAMLARRGQSVLVVEDHDRPGGYCRSIRSGSYQFDPAVHFVMGGGSGVPGAGLVDRVLELIGSSDRCELVRADPFYEAIFPDLSVRVGAGRENFVGPLAELFPEEEAGVRALVDLGERLYEEFVRFPASPSWLDLLSSPRRAPTSFRYRNATLADLTDQHLRDPRLAALYSALYPYVGLPPSRVAFGTWALMLASFCGEGAFYCRGGFQRLADAFAAGLVNQGGELLLERRARRIVVEGGRVVGVELDAGERIACEKVVATGDARATFFSLVGEEHVPRRLRRRLRNGELTADTLTLFLETDLDPGALGVAHETVVLRSWDLDAAYDAALGGDATSFMVTIPTLTDPDRAPSGRHQVVVSRFAPRPSTRPDLSRVGDDLLQAAGTVVPGLADHVTGVAHPGGGAGESTALPLLRTRAIYGWATTPQQSGMNRLPQTTPIPGLTLAGQWTRPGHGVWTVIVSGIYAARIVLGHHTGEGLAPLFS